jgi:soluble lytic murein transglycosylase-like protein
MKYFSLTFAWATFIGVVMLSRSVSLTGADPTDDLSLTLGKSSNHSQVYSLLPEYQVAEILKDRLDLFPRSQIPRLSKHIVYLCRHYRFDPAFVLSLIQVESGFRTRAISQVGAVGLMQLMLPTAQFVIEQLGFHFSGYENFARHSLSRRSLRSSMLMDPFVNTAIGIAYLAWLRDYYHGSPYHLLAAYNVGPARMNELLARKSFRPTETKKYFLAIRRGVPSFRFYEKRKIGI